MKIYSVYIKISQKMKMSLCDRSNCGAHKQYFIDGLYFRMFLYKSEFSISHINVESSPFKLLYYNYDKIIKVWCEPKMLYRIMLHLYRHVL